MMGTMRKYRVWAPYADEVELLLHGDATKSHPMTAEGDSGWFTSEQEMTPGQRYQFRVRKAEAGDAEASDAGANDSAAESPEWSIPLPDPRSQHQPEGPHGPSEVIDLADFTWNDHNWTGRILPGGLIYELHVGTFSPSADFAGLVEKLDHLVDLGVTHVELMPVQPFGGNRNWGYDGVSWMAVHEGYGGPRGLQQLIDACHQRGLAVILDVVYNHFGPDGNYVGFFGPYTQPGDTGWGDVVNLIGDDSDEVRAYILDAIRQWFVDYHVDGLRLDAVHALHDPGAFHILEQMQEVADTVASQTGIPRTLIAESDQNDPRLVRPRAAGGFGLAAQWDDDVHHAIHTLVSGEDHAYYGDFGTVEVLAQTLQTGFWHTDRYSSFRGRTHGRPFDLAVQPMNALVTYTTTHDQTGNRAQGDRPSMNLTAQQQLLKAAVVACSPFTPMLFQGEEWGASTPFAFFCSHESDELQRLTREGRLREFSRAGWNPDEVADPSAPETYENSILKWDEVTSGAHQQILQAYQELFALRRRLPQLTNPWADSVQVKTSGNQMQLIRTNHGTKPVVLVANFSAQPADVVVTELTENPEVLQQFEQVEITAADGGYTVALPAWGYAVIS